MFGGILGGVFGGEDVNAAGPTTGGGGQEEGGGGQEFPRSDFQGMTNPNNEYVDPAESASEKANEATKPFQLREFAENAGRRGLFTDIHKIAMGRSLGRRERVFRRHQAEFLYNQAQRAKEAYIAESDRQRQALQQSYSGRGLGQSSIAQEGMDYFEKARTRALANLGENMTLASMHKSVVDSSIKFSYGAQYVGLADDILALL